METKLSNFQKLKGLIEQAYSPFTTTETLSDIKQILKTSDGFDGYNHLCIVAFYLDKENQLFYITKEEAEEQLELALKEHCDIAYYFVYRFYRDTDKNKARAALYLMSEFNYGAALLSLAKEYERGDLFPLDYDKAYEYYRKAMDAKEIDAFIQGLLLVKRKDKLIIKPTLYLKMSNYEAEVLSTYKKDKNIKAFEVLNILFRYLNFDIEDMNLLNISFKNDDGNKIVLILDDREINMLEKALESRSSNLKSIYDEETLWIIEKHLNINKVKDDLVYINKKISIPDDAENQIYKKAEQLNIKLPGEVK